MSMDAEPDMDGLSPAPDSPDVDGTPPPDGVGTFMEPEDTFMDADATAVDGDDSAAMEVPLQTFLERFGWSFPLMLAAFIALYLVQWHVGMNESIHAAALIKGDDVPILSMRLMSGPLIHANLIHILFNMLFFKELAIAIHHLFGDWMVFTVFVVSAIAGSFASILFLPHLASVGASGGILGTVGFMLVFSYRNRALLPPGLYKAFLKDMVLIGAFGLLLHRFVDNPAHAGGFVAGCLLGLLLTPARAESLPVQNGALIKPLGMVCGVVFAVSVAWTIWAMLA